MKETLDILSIKHSYIENSNTLTFLADQATHNKLKSIIQDNDNVAAQFQLKITILETNENEIKERGTNIQSYAQSLTGDTQYFLQLLTNPFSSSINTFPSSNLGFYGVLRYLNENGFTKILSSPHFTVQSNKSIYFSSVQNIPYKIGNTSLTGANESTTEQIQYQDVGLKINLLPKVIGEKIFVDLKLIVENILDKNSLTPSTSKRELNNSFQLTKGETLVLSGISQEEDQTIHHGIPFLEDIWLLGHLFKFDSIEHLVTNLTVSIEVL